MLEYLFFKQVAEVNAVMNDDSLSTIVLRIIMLTYARELYHANTHFLLKEHVVFVYGVECIFSRERKVLCTGVC